jgi:hypothetical protein
MRLDGKVTLITGRNNSSPKCPEWTLDFMALPTGFEPVLQP